MSKRGHLEQRLLSFFLYLLQQQSFTLSAIIIPAVCNFFSAFFCFFFLPKTNTHD